MQEPVYNEDRGVVRHVNSYVQSIDDVTSLAGLSDHQMIVWMPSDNQGAMLRCGYPAGQQYQVAHTS